MHKDNRLKTKSDFSNLYINSKRLINNELILILGDYDADGTTAASILHLYFKF